MHFKQSVSRGANIRRGHSEQTIIIMYNVKNMLHIYDIKG